MKRSLLFFGIFSFMLSSCTNNMEDIDKKLSTDIKTKSQTTESLTGITLKWDYEVQEMDGFGVAQAGWADYLHAHAKRDEVLDLLFGDNGLRCNILRGEIFPGYAKAKNVFDFEMNLDTDISPNDPYFNNLPNSSPDESFARRGQLWLCKEVKNKYNVDKLVFSAWTPPAYMKSNNNVSGGFLPIWNYNGFANYLAEFCKAYNAAGLDVYAISPANEPEYAASWNSCLWLPASTLGSFITKNLYPTLQQNGLDTKIIFGENAQWSTFAAIMGSQKYVESILRSYPQIAGMNTIAAGHGYTNPVKEVLEWWEREIAIVPWPKAEEAGLKVWLTEISMSRNSDYSMDDAINWATTFHKYIVTANTSAVIWWGGAIKEGGSECLISLNTDRQDYVIADRFYTFGNFSRYIKPGSTQIGVKKGTAIPGDLLVSAYKKGNEYVAVAVNPFEEAYEDEFTIENVNGINTMKCIITNEDNKWTEVEVTPDVNGKFPFAIPAKSVVTFVGNVN